MSVGNLKDQGNKGNNFPYQLRTLQLLDAINQSISALPGADYEFIVNTYEATANGTGYNIGEIVTRYDTVNVATGVVSSTVWFNQNTQTYIAAPVATEIVPVSSIPKMDRIKASLDYERVFTYNGTGDVATIVHSGTTAVGLESITETFTYVAGNVTSIKYS